MRARATVMLRGGGARRSDRLLVALFALLLAAPGLLQLLGLAQSGPEVEQRQLSRPPSWDSWSRGWRRLAGELDAYLTDHMGLRPQLLEAVAEARRLLGAPASPMVVAGRSGWLFIDNEHSIEQHAGRRPLAPEVLRQQVGVIRRLHAWLAARGIGFVFVIAPDKETIYPEFLPPGLRLSGPNPADQLLAALAAHREIPVVDLRPVLRAAKPLGRLYMMSDTHWTSLGGFVGLQAVLQRAGRNLPPLSFYGIETARVPGDLARMARWPAPPDEAWVIPVRRFPDPVLASRTVSTAPLEMVIETRLRGGGRILVLSDSFGVVWLPYLADIAERVVWRFDHRNLDLAWIEAQKPDLVIVELIERFVPEWPGPEARAWGEGWAAEVSAAAPLSGGSAASR
ncbi:MAG: hypothetical protein U1E53_22510 [Dongiaceae bacterium]